MIKSLLSSATLGVVFVIGFAASSVQAADYVWMAPKSGATTNWFAAKNWKRVGAPETARAADSKFKTVAWGHNARPGVQIAGVPGPRDRAVISAGAKVAIDKPITVASLVIQAGGTVQGAGDITITSRLTVRDARLLGEGNLEIAPNATATFKGDATGNTISKEINNAGAVNLESGNLEIHSDFRNGGSFDIGANAQLQGAEGSKPVFRNEGTLVSSFGRNAIAIPFRNLGNVFVRGGNLDLGPRFVQSGGSLNLDGGGVSSEGTLQITGGKVAGSGDIRCDVVNGGTLKPGHSPGRIVIYGNYTQTYNGTLGMEIGGTVPATQYDQLEVRGIATLNGTLDIIAYNGYLPAPNKNFLLLSYYSSNTNFATINGRFPGGPVYYRVTKTGTNFIAQGVTDITAPDIIISAPVNGNSYTNLSSVQGTASDSQLGVPKSGVHSIKVVVYRYNNSTETSGYWDGASGWSASCSASNELLATGTTSWSLALPTLTAGNYLVRAIGKDNNGNSVTTSDFEFTITGSGSGG